MPSVFATPAARVRAFARETWGFAIGSLFFFVGALPVYAVAVGVVVTNVTFVVGALFFTAAALLQFVLGGIRPRLSARDAPGALDWWASAVQVAGTLFFNISTTEALITALDPATGVGGGWRPDAFGSTCFLVASALAVVAVRRRQGRGRGRLCAGLNLLGSVFFGVSAVGAYVAPTATDVVSLFWANVGTMLGALCFLAAALLGRKGSAS